MEPLANEELKPCNLVPGKMEETEIEMQVRSMSGMLTCSNVVGVFKKKKLVVYFPVVLLSSRYFPTTEWLTISQ